MTTTIQLIDGHFYEVKTDSAGKVVSKLGRILFSPGVYKLIDGQVTKTAPSQFIDISSSVGQ